MIRSYCQAWLPMATLAFGFTLSSTWGQQAATRPPTAPSYPDESVPTPAPPQLRAAAKPGAAGDAAAVAKQIEETPRLQGEVEVIQERYPSGKVRIAREVIQDEAGNYLNHGSWRMWDEQGQLVAQGQMERGQRQGTWVRLYANPNEVPLFAREPYKQFARPFVSQATFVDDKLDGEWTIHDGRQRKISQWHFAEGQRHGTSTWWHANGRKMREVPYSYGLIEGELLEWDAENHVLTSEQFEAGRRLATKIDRHPNGRKKSEGTYLMAKLVEKTPDDWWTCTLQALAREGEDERHGPWAMWSEDGRKVCEGAYEHDVEIGLFTWWHTNGQKAVEGKFIDGVASGQWTWWTEAGKKELAGLYADGEPTGDWTWWDAKGAIVQRANMTGDTPYVFDTRVPEPLPTASRPTEPVRKLR